jgi:predicted AAA+ superfamily ATPase
METLFAKQDRLLDRTQTSLVRHQMQEINWNARLLAIRGARGVGKSTLMLQYIKTHYAQYSREVLYCTLDSIYFASHNLLELADTFYKYGGRHLFLDEVHKYKKWSSEVKEIYDMYPNMRVVISGSSLLKILTGDADLSRRCVPYAMQGLSFREYLQFYKGINIEPVKLEDVLSHPEGICSLVNAECQPLPLFKDYLKYGYFPFYLENNIDYYTQMEQVVNYVVETELPSECSVDVTNVRKIKALIGILATTIPFEVDISKLSSMIEAHRNTVIEYLSHLNRARVLNLLYSQISTVKKMQKPDKIYLENPNLIYALASDDVKIGTVRETFVVNQLSYGHTVEYGKTAGDFKVDGRHTFEVGGKSKTYEQIAGIPDSYILADDMETPFGHKFPIWVVGFLY